MTSPLNYYMISNRTYEGGQFGTTVAQGGALTFLYAPVSSPTSWTVTPQASWLALVQADLLSCKGPALLFVHGYGVTSPDAATIFPTYFGNLVNGGYPGVLIGFDWPSDDTAGSSKSLRQQEAAFQQAKSNARTTGSESFPLLASLLAQLQISTHAPLVAICHSMGNYAMWAGAGAFQPGTFSQILCVASMLEFSGFNNPDSPTYCQDIQQAAGQVTIYWSSHDDVLPFAQWRGFDGYKELGLNGPQSPGGLLSGVVAVDCSLVVNQENARTYDPAGNPLSVIHTSYFFIPQVLTDMTEALAGWAPGSIPDRSPTHYPNVFTMNALPAAKPADKAEKAEKARAAAPATTAAQARAVMPTSG